MGQLSETLSGHLHVDPSKFEDFLPKLVEILTEQQPLVHLFQNTLVKVIQQLTFIFGSCKGVITNIEEHASKTSSQDISSTFLQLLSANSDINIRQMLKMFFLIGYSTYETDLSAMLDRVFTDNEEDPQDLLFRINFAKNTIKIEQSDLSANVQTTIAVYQKITSNLIALNWQDSILIPILTETMVLQLERKIEVSRDMYKQPNLFVNIEMWSSQIILKFFTFVCL